jgi:hypothetical protein
VDKTLSSKSGINWIMSFFLSTRYLFNIYTFRYIAKTLVEWSNKYRSMHNDTKYHNNRIVCVVLQVRVMRCSCKNTSNTLSDVDKMGPSSGDVHVEKIIDITKHCY